jgi:hypothetical protein
VTSPRSEIDLDRLARSFAAVGELIDAIQPGQCSARVARAFGQPGALDRSHQGPLGVATGLERLKIRMYDLLAHGWDLAQALGRPADLPEDAAEVARVRVRTGEQSVPAAVVSARPGPSPRTPPPSTGWSRSSAAT